MLTMRIGRTACCVCASLVMCLAWPVPALAQGDLHNTQGSAGTANPYDAARAAFEALPETMRKTVQNNLVWTGDYNGGVDGEFGRMSFGAIRAFKQRQPNAPAGAVLTPQDIAVLGREAARVRAAAGFRIQRDGATGSVIGVPEKLVTQRAKTRSGTRLDMRQHGARLETFALAGADLKQLFANLRGAGGLKVSYSVLRDDFLVVAGETPNGLVYTRAARGEQAGQPALRGFTLTYPRNQRGMFQRLSVAISNSYDPFPGPAASDASTVAAAAAKVAADTPPPPPAEFLWGSALAVAPDTYLAVLPAIGCAGIRIGKAPATVLAHDKSTGLAVVRAPVGGGVPAGAVFAAAGPGQDAFALFANATGPVGDPEISLARGKLTGPSDARRLQIAMPVNGAGALVVAADGRAAGLAGAGGVTVATLASASPLLRRPVIPARTIMEFMAAASIAAADAPQATGATVTPAAVAARYARGIASVWCRR